MSTRPKYNEEQEQALAALNTAFDSMATAREALAFMERELGKVHAITCKYRLEVVARLDKGFASAQAHVWACGAGDILWKAVADEDQRIGPTTPAEMSKAVKDKAAGMSKWKVASEIGITRVTLDKVIKGHGCHRGTAHKVIEWLKQRD